MKLMKRAVLAIVLGLASTFAAQASGPGMVRIANQASEIIDKHDVCRLVTNVSGSGLMVPTNSAEEWGNHSNSFTRNVSSMTGVNLRECQIGGSRFYSPTPQTVSPGGASQFRFGNSTHISGDGTRIVTLSDNVLTVVGAASEVKLHTYNLNGSGVYVPAPAQVITAASATTNVRMMTMSGDGNRLFTFPVKVFEHSGSTFTQVTTKTWDPYSQARGSNHAFANYQTNPTQISVSPDGTRAAYIASGFSAGPNPVEFDDPRHFSIIYFLWKDGSTWREQEVQVSGKSAVVGDFDANNRFIAAVTHISSDFQTSSGGNKDAGIKATVLSIREFTLSGTTWSQTRNQAIGADPEAKIIQHMAVSGTAGKLVLVRQKGVNLTADPLSLYDFSIRKSFETNADYQGEIDTYTRSGAAWVFQASQETGDIPGLSMMRNVNLDRILYPTVTFFSTYFDQSGNRYIAMTPDGQHLWLGSQTAGYSKLLASSVGPGWFLDGNFMAEDYQNEHEPEGYPTTPNGYHHGRVWSVYSSNAISLTADGSKAVISWPQDERGAPNDVRYKTDPRSWGSFYLFDLNKK